MVIGNVVTIAGTAEAAPPPVDPVEPPPVPPVVVPNVFDVVVVVALVVRSNVLLESKIADEDP